VSLVHSLPFLLCISMAAGRCVYGRAGCYWRVCRSSWSAYQTRLEFTPGTSIRRGRYRKFYARVARTARRRSFGRTRFTDIIIIIIITIIYTAPKERKLLLLRRRRYVCSKRRAALKVHETVAAATVVASVKNSIPTTSAQGNSVRRSRRCCVIVVAVFRGVVSKRL